MRNSVNKYAVLHSVPDDDDDDHESRILKDRVIVDQFLNKNLQPTPTEAAKWSEDMRNYYKEKTSGQTSLETDKGLNEVVEYVFSDNIGIAMTMEVNEVSGLDAHILNNECN